MRKNSSDTMHQVDEESHNCKSSAIAAWPALAPIRTTKKSDEIEFVPDFGSQGAAINDTNCNGEAVVVNHNSYSRQKISSCGSPFSSDASVRRRFSQAISSSSLCSVVDSNLRAVICADDADSGCIDACAQYLTTCNENSHDLVQYKESSNTKDVQTAYQDGRIRFYRFFVDSSICRRSRNAIKTLVLCFCHSPRSSMHQNQYNDCTPMRSVSSGFPANYTVFPAWNSNTSTKPSGSMSLYCNMYGAATTTTPNGTPSTPIRHGVLLSPQRSHQRSVGMSPKPKLLSSVSWQSHLVNSPRSRLYVRSTSAKASKGSGITFPMSRLGDGPHDYRQDQLNEPTSPKVTCIGKVHLDSGCKKYKNLDRREPHLVNKKIISEVKDKPAEKRSSRNPIGFAETYDRVGSFKYETDSVPEQRLSSITSMNVCPQKFSVTEPHNQQKIRAFKDNQAAACTDTYLKSLHFTRSPQLSRSQKFSFKSIVNKLEAI